MQHSMSDNDVATTTGGTAVIAEMEQTRRTGMQTGTKSVLLAGFIFIGRLLSSSFNI